MEPSPDPTPDQIAELTAVIRSTWTPTEHRRRAAGRTGDRHWQVTPVEHWQPPVISVIDVDAIEVARS